MQISNVLSGFTDATKLGDKKAAAAAGAMTKILKPGDAASQPSDVARAAMRDIMKRYDVTDITPEDYTRMITKLHDANAISDQEFQELSSIRTELESQGVAADQTVNLVQLYGDGVRKAQQQAGNQLDAASRQKLAPSMRKLDWLQKFALIHANPDAAGIDLAA
jgi:hypothetical protein